MQIQNSQGHVEVPSEVLRAYLDRIPRTDDHDQRATDPEQGQEHEHGDAPPSASEPTIQDLPLPVSDSFHSTSTHREDQDHDADDHELDPRKAGPSKPRVSKKRKQSNSPRLSPPSIYSPSEDHSAPLAGQTYHTLPSLPSVSHPYASNQDHHYAHSQSQTHAHQSAPLGVGQQGGHQHPHQHQHLNPHLHHTDDLGPYGPTDDSTGGQGQLPLLADRASGVGEDSGIQSSIGEDPYGRELDHFGSADVGGQAHGDLEAEGEGSSGGGNGRKGKGRELSKTKRAEQNRKAQRAFRQRRDQNIKDLSDKAEQLLIAQQNEADANRRWQEAQVKIEQLRNENAALRTALTLMRTERSDVRTNIDPNRSLSHPQELDHPHSHASDGAENGAISGTGTGVGDIQSDEKADEDLGLSGVDAVVGVVTEESGERKDLG
ncbi:Basic-leucine zipper domain [Phaffia rhodozyma]|uniref:Basic-leucine zipper domain n=1 Tax=Phaffia rhodozyma TaxID=264483 RepID=A0A0F7SQ37_PHARH|nr:Basic-leucine zipper domain [Phaffia rhodozyma]